MPESTSQPRPRSLSIVSIDTITADPLSTSSNSSLPVHSQPTESQLPSYTQGAAEIANRAGPPNPAPSQSSNPAPSQPSNPAPSQPSSPAPSQPSNPTPSQPTNPTPSQPTSSWPQWISEAISSIKETHPNERIQPTMRSYTINGSNQIVPKIRCLDCPGKLYSCGPGQTLDNFQIHLRNRDHKRNVQRRLLQTSLETSSGPGTASTGKGVMKDTNRLINQMIEASTQARTANAGFPSEIRLALETAARQLSTTPINKPLPHPIPTIPTYLTTQFLDPTFLAKQIINTTLNQFNLALLESGPSFEEVQRWRGCLVEAAQKFEIQSLKSIADNGPLFDPSKDAPAMEDRNESPLLELPPDLMTATKEEFLDRLREEKEGRESPGLEFEDFWEDVEMEDPEGVDIAEEIETPVEKSSVYTGNDLEEPKENGKVREDANEHDRVLLEEELGVSQALKTTEHEIFEDTIAHEEETQQDDDNDQQPRLDKGKGKSTETDEDRPKERFRGRSITPSHFAHSLYRPSSKSPCISWSESSHEYEPDAPAPWSPGSPPAYRTASPPLPYCEETATPLDDTQKDTEGQPQLILKGKLEGGQRISRGPSPVPPSTSLQVNTGSNAAPCSTPQPPRNPVLDNNRNPTYSPTSPTYTPTGPRSPIYSPTSPTFTPYRSSSPLHPYRTLATTASCKDVTTELTSLLTESMHNLTRHIFSLPPHAFSSLSVLSTQIHEVHLKLTNWSSSFTQLPENAPPKSIIIADEIIDKSIAALINIGYKIKKECGDYNPAGSGMLDLTKWFYKIEEVETAALEAAGALWSIAGALTDPYEELEAPELLMCDGSKRRRDEDETKTEGKEKRRKTRWDVRPVSVCRD